MANTSDNDNGGAVGGRIYARKNASAKSGTSSKDKDREEKDVDINTGVIWGEEDLLT